MATVPRWKPTDQASAAKLNELADGVNSAIDPSAGQNPPPTAKTLLEIFELTEDITYPDSGDSEFPDDLTIPPDVPFAENCKIIWLKGSANVYQTDGSEEQTVYFPCIRDFTQGEPVARIAEDRVEAKWNNQAGRWECDISDHGGPFWGTLDDALTQGGSQTVSITDADGEVTAHDELLGSGDELASATKVKVTWFRYLRKWYVTAAECD
jgi:hypothetical protein